MDIMKTISQILRGNRSPDDRDHLSPNLSAHLVCCGIGGAIGRRLPFLASRLGWFEAYSIGHWDSKGNLNNSLRERMWNNPGIFPATDQGFERFHATYTEAMKEADILGLMKCPHEKAVVTRHAPKALLCELGDLEPYYHPVPWSKYLAGLRVLVNTQKNCRRYNRGELVLAAVPKNILATLDLTGFIPLFKFFDTSLLAVGNF